MLNAVLSPKPKLGDKEYGLAVGGPEWDAMAERAKQRRLVEEELLATGAILCGQPSPSLDEEANDWLRRFYHAGASIRLDYQPGWPSRIGYHIDSKAERAAFPLLIWLEKAAERQPGIKRRVVEIACGFDHMLAQRRGS